MVASAKSTEEKLLLKPHEVAARLSISERQLWAQTRPRGPIPCVRIGSCVRYAPDALKALIGPNKDDSFQIPGKILAVGSSPQVGRCELRHVLNVLRDRQRESGVRHGK